MLTKHKMNKYKITWIEVAECHSNFVEAEYDEVIKAKSEDEALLKWAKDNVKDIQKVKG